MNQVSTLNKNGGLTINTLEVAEMMEVNHYKILEKLEGTKDRKTKGIIPILTAHEVVVSEYFIESSYKDESGKTNKCYECTRLGCDFLANKFTGEKGILFTAKYVKKFSEMKEKLKQPMPQLSKELQAIFVLDERTMGLENELKDMKGGMPLFNIECKELQGLVRKVGTKALGGYRSPAYKDNSLRAKVYKDIQGQLKREFGVDKYEAIKRIQLDKAKEIVTNYKVPIVTQDEITLLNNQIRM